jgi:Tfp pilus assembly protein PilF/TolB-like protein
LECLALGTIALLWQIQSQRLAARVLQNQLAAHSITVLPFLDLDNAEADEGLSGALARNLQADLSKTGAVRIVSVTGGGSPWAGTGNIGDIGEANRELRSRAVLTGTKRLVGGALRLSVRMMNAATGDMLFTKSFETAPEVNSLSALRAAITGPIRATLNANDWSSIAASSRDPGMRNARAREFILSGRQLLFRDTIEDYDRSIRCLEKALSIEPNSAIAHAYLSSTQVSRTHFAPEAKLLDRAEHEAREALRLEPDSPEGHRALAGVFYQRNNLVDALEQQLRAVELAGPEERVASFIGMTLISLGRPDRALGWLEMANRWTSLPGSYDALIGDCWGLLGQDDRAEAAYRRAIDLRPETPDGWVGLCHLRLLQSDLHAARQIHEENWTRTKGYEGVKNDNHPTEMLAQIELFARNYAAAERLYSELAKGHSAGGVASYGAVSYASALGRLRQALGDEIGAEMLLRECLTAERTAESSTTNVLSLYRIAAIESSLGEGEASLKHLQAAVEAGWIDYRSLRQDPRFDAVAGHAHFKEIISSLTAKVSELGRPKGQPINMASTRNSSLKTGDMK